MSWPACWLRGPVWPQPVIRAYTSRSLTFAQSSGPEAQPLGDTGPIALDQHVGLGDQRQHLFTALVGLQVGRHRTPVAVHGLVAALRHSPGSAGALDAHHVGAEVGEDHRRVRSGADAGQFDDSQSLQWSRH